MDTILAASGQPLLEKLTQCLTTDLGGHFPQDPEKTGFCSAVRKTLQWTEGRLDLSFCELTSGLTEMKPLGTLAFYLCRLLCIGGL